jgi:hypothetical protein
VLEDQVKSVTALLWIATLLALLLAHTQGAQAQDTNQWNDLDEYPVGLSIIAGYEGAWSASQPGSSNAFIRAYGRRIAHTQTSRTDRFTPDRVGVWYSVRLLSAPQASDTNNVISVFTDPQGTLKPQNFTSVGQAADFALGVDWQLINSDGGRSTLSIIAGAGATTPGPANSVTLSYIVPALGTVECTTLRTRFAADYALDDISASDSTNCLVNQNGGINTPVATLAFTNPDRTNFFGKYSVGFRITNRYHTGDFRVCGHEDITTNFTLGQDQTITGGSWRHVVFTIDFAHPMPVKDLNFIYLFGSAGLRLSANQSQSPLILAAAPTSSVKPGDPSVLVLPLKQPDRDFYRIGVGLSLSQVFTALVKK